MEKGDASLWTKSTETVFSPEVASADEKQRENGRSFGKRRKFKRGSAR